MAEKSNQKWLVLRSFLLMSTRFICIPSFKPWPSHFPQVAWRSTEGDMRERTMGGGNGSLTGEEDDKGHHQAKRAPWPQRGQSPEWCRSAAALGKGSSHNQWWGSQRKAESVSCSVVSNSLQPHGLQPTRLLCPWNSPGKNTGVGSYSLLQGIILTLDRTWSLALQADSLPSETQGSPRLPNTVLIPVLEPATPAVAAPAAMNLTTVSMSLERALVWKLWLGVSEVVRNTGLPGYWGHQLSASRCF